MKRKEELRVTKTKKNLYESLLTLMKNKTFEEIKVSDICQISLTNRSTFYDHFNDKYELLSSLIHDLEEELIIKLQENKNLQTAKEYYLQMISLLLDHITENIDIYTSIIKNNNNSIANDMLRNTLLKDVEKHIEANHNYQGNIPLEIISNFYVSAVINVCVSYIVEPKKYSKDDILSYISQLLPDNIY